MLLGPACAASCACAATTSSTATTRTPSKTAEAFDDEGWFHTGDLGTVDDDGRISYQGRLKDMLKVGGENVAAIEIESYLGDASGGVDRPGGGRAGRQVRGGGGGVPRAASRGRR